MKCAMAAEFETVAVGKCLAVFLSCLKRFSNFVISFRHSMLTVHATGAD